VQFAFGDLVLDTDRFLLERGGEALHVQPQVFDVISHLVLNRERVVPKTELLDTIWGDRFVSESTLTSRIKVARQMVGDDGIHQSHIKTVHGRGYRWVADVTVEPGRPASTQRSPAPAVRRVEQRIRFCTTADGARVAYATAGVGPPLVRAAHWITHLDYDWESPVWRHWMEGLSRDRMLVRYDERGCGLSDHDPAEISFEAFVRDLETVVDELGLERFPLLGVSQGGAVAVAYAQRHPERVSRLVLVGAYITGGRHVRTPQERAEYEMQRELIRMGWGRDNHSFRLFFSSTFMPDVPPQLWSDFAELMRRTTSAENAVRIFDVLLDLDVRDVAAQLTLPTLILHAREDARIPFSESVAYASRIRGSRLVPLDSRNHLMRADEPAWAHALREIDAFLAEGESTQSPREVHVLS
jgi:pimeloyl-ACP methyl ester carboxylesterase